MFMSRMMIAALCLMTCACSGEKTETPTPDDVAALRAQADRLEAQMRQNSQTGPAKASPAKDPVKAEAPKGLPDNAIRLAPSVIMDWTGFNQPMVAATMFVPHGWVAEGGIEWGNDYACTNGYGYKWQSSSPDKLKGVVILPQQKWEWNATGAPMQPGCPVAQISTVEDYITTLVSIVMPDARVLKTYPRPDTERENASVNSQNNTGFQYMKTQLDAGEAIISYTENGVEMRGVVTAAVVYNYIRTGGGQYGPAIESWSGYAVPTFAGFAPAKSFNQSMFEGIRHSFTPDPNWEAAIAGHNATMGRIASKGIMDRAQISRQTYEDIRQISQSAWESQQKSSDIRAREFSEYIRDVETYDDASSMTGRTELNSGYNHAWRMNDGTYVLTDDPSFNPYGALGMDGQELGITR